jgi:hypothetical protein
MMKRSLLVLLIIIIGTAGGYAQKKGTSSGDRMLVKPDLQVHGVTVEKTGETALHNHRVKITVKVKNACRLKSCSGPFKLKIEWTETASPGYHYLGEAGIDQLCTSPASARLAVATRYFEDTVPVGNTREYKVTVDYLGQVVEAKEDNNEAVAEYEARRTVAMAPGSTVHMSRICPGVDLALTRVEIRRTDRGVYIKAYAKNICVGNCSGGVRFILDESEVAGEPSAVSQDIAVSISSGGEYSTSGWIGVRYEDGRTCAYTARVEALSPCSETNTANNSCRVSIGPSETYKDQRCR